MIIKEVKMKALQNQKGFTLIELVVIIVILGVLAIIAIPLAVQVVSIASIASLLQANNRRVESAIRAQVVTESAVQFSRSLIQVVYFVVVNEHFLTD